MGYGTGWDAVWGRDVYGRVFGDNAAESAVEKCTHDDLSRSENTLIRDYFLGRSHYTKKNTTIIYTAQVDDYDDA